MVEDARPAVREEVNQHAGLRIVGGGGDDIANHLNGGSDFTTRRLGAGSSNGKTTWQAESRLWGRGLDSGNVFDDMHISCIHPRR